MMAEIRLCEVCTEIHYDNRDLPNYTRNECPELVNTGDPLVIEIWNNVFMEYYRFSCDDTINSDNSGTVIDNESNSDKKIAYKKLNKFYVDTGMGLERLAMILQKKKFTIYN